MSDSATRSDEEIDGAIYSADDLIITGTGALTVTAEFADGIVGKDDLAIESGTITVTSADDGIRDKDSLTISGGTITIDAAGDGIKSSDTDALDSNGDLTITGGTIDVTAQSAFDFDGTGTLTGGTVIVNGAQITTLTNQMIGGGGRP